MANRGLAKLAGLGGQVGRYSITILDQKSLAGDCSIETSSFRFDALEFENLFLQSIFFEDNFGLIEVISAVDFVGEYVIF